MNKLASRYLIASPIACVPLTQPETIPKCGTSLAPSHSI